MASLLGAERLFGVLTPGWTLIQVYPVHDGVFDTFKVLVVLPR